MNIPPFSQAHRPISVVVVGQTPPPIHGQSLMIQMLLDGARNGSMAGIQLHHVRMAFSDNMDQVGRFQLRKVGHLIGLIFRILMAHFRCKAQVLYYPPAGPNSVPLLRDLVILTATRWLFARTVFHFQASGSSEKIESFPRPLRWLVKRAFLKPCASIQLSQFAVDDASYFDSKNIYTIPNAAHDEAKRLGWSTTTLIAHRQRSSEQPVRLLYVGTVCESKGILVLLEACRLLATKGFHFHLDIVGSFQPASFEKKIHVQLTEMRIESAVTLHGQKTGNAKWRMFADADIFCFPSHYESEGFPCVLVEAMCFSLPIVSTRWRGIPSIVDHGVTGFLCEIQSPESIQESLCQLIQSLELRQRMGAAARTIYESELTPDLHFKKMQEVFVNLNVN
jgi:glycosyltransferase involved in cell wall biosynthesis